MGIAATHALWYNEPAGAKSYGLDADSCKAVRPVITLEPGVLDSVSGEGTSTSPYILD